MLELIVGCNSYFNCGCLFFVQVKEVISLAFSSGSKVPETINSLLSDCVLESEEPQRRVIFELCIQALNNELLQTMDARDITGKLLFEVVHV